MQFCSRRETPALLFRYLSIGYRLCPQKKIVEVEVDCCCSTALASKTPFLSPSQQFICDLQPKDLGTGGERGIICRWKIAVILQQIKRSRWPRRVCQCRRCMQAETCARAGLEHRQPFRRCHKTDQMSAAHIYVYGLRRYCMALHADFRPCQTINMLASLF